MNDDHQLAPPRVKVSFHRSSTKDGQTGYSVEGSEGLTRSEAERVFALVAELKRMADAELAFKDALADDLKRSLAQTDRRAWRTNRSQAEQADNWLADQADPGS